MEYFTRKEVEGVDRAHDLQYILGWPSNQQLITVLSKNFIINCPVLSDDVRCAHAIYVPATAILKGKMARKKPKHIEFKQHIPIQRGIHKYHPELPLHMNFFSSTDTHILEWSLGK